MNKPENLRSLRNYFTFVGIGSSVTRLVTSLAHTFGQTGILNTPDTPDVDPTVTDPINDTPDPDPVVPVDGEVTPEIGEGIDLSHLSHGYTDSFGGGHTSLITEAGKNVSFDRMVEHNGQRWFHFIQPDGKGYAWFPESDLGDLANELTSGGMSL